MCEAFGCLPSQALRELERDSELVFAILNLRQYRDGFARWKQIEALPKLKDRNKARQGDEVVAEVIANMFALKHGEIDGGPGDGHS